jgi:predicted nucleotidyltransferase
MAVAGIIAEYDPFHWGHGALIGALRHRLGEDTPAVVALSGCFLQRGAFAMVDKYARGEMAILGGADLVLELPSPWSCATAERFAQGGVALLAETGVVTHLVFGSESGDLAPLQHTAACLDSDAYHAALKDHLAQGVTYAAARQRAAQALIGEDAQCLQSPNNALAVEYLRANAALGEPMEPVTFRRLGAGHDSLDDSEYASASAVRARLFAGEDWRELVPETTAAVLDRELASGRAPVTMANCERAILARLRRMEETDFARYDGGGEGLYHRFYRAVRQGRSVEEILSLAKTKRYPLARLRRLLLHSYLDLIPASPGDTPPYLRLLAANARGRALLRQMGKSVPVLTKPADVGRLGPEAQALFAQEARWADLYALGYPDLSQAVPGMEYTRGPVIR